MNAKLIINNINTYCLKVSSWLEVYKLNQRLWQAFFINLLVLALINKFIFKVQMEISLPDETGRVQILNIHTARMKEFKKICPDVDVKVFNK